VAAWSGIHLTPCSSSWSTQSQLWMLEGEGWGVCMCITCWKYHLYQLSCVFLVIRSGHVIHYIMLRTTPQNMQLCENVDCVVYNSPCHPSAVNVRCHPHTLPRTLHLPFLLPPLPPASPALAPLLSI
jgi:hypothetical protein